MELNQRQNQTGDKVIISQSEASSGRLLHQTTEVSLISQSQASLVSSSNLNGHDKSPDNRITQ